jgi:hypothetical protein
MRYLIKSSNVDSNNYNTIIAEIDLFDDSNTSTGSVTVNIPPVFVTQIGWKNAVVASTNTDYENELIAMYSNTWTNTLITEYKNNNQPMLDNLNIHTVGYFTIEELDLILNDLLNE